MTRTLIGIDYEGVPSLKITKDDLNPITTPDDTPGAFLFNSKDLIQTTINGVEVTSANADNGTTPVGSNINNFQRWRYFYSSSGSNGWWYYAYQASFFSSLDFQVPLFDFVTKDPRSGLYTKGKFRNYDFGNQPTTVGYVFATTPGCKQGEAGWKINYTANVTDWTGANVNPSYLRLYSRLLTFLSTNGVGTGLIGAPEFTYADIVMWNLPGDNTPLPQPQPFQAGQKSIRIDHNGLKIAKPGYDVDVATETQLAVSSSRRPNKIIAADDIVIPEGTSDYMLAVTIPANSVCDIQYYVGEQITYPYPPRQGAIGADWELLPDRIRFYNAGTACRGRFVVIANDLVSQTTGDNEVFRQFDFNGENVVQFLRPGAGDPPAFSDIILDSRWPALRILKEGYFEVGAVGSGEQITNIPIDTSGYFPFVKFMVYTAGQAFSAGENYTNCVRPPSVGMYRDGSSTWFETGDTTLAKITANNVAFHSYRGRLKYVYYTYNSSSGQWTRRVVMPDEVLGIRYYIFGIPKKDTP